MKKISTKVKKLSTILIILIIGITYYIVLSTEFNTGRATISPDNIRSVPPRLIKFDSNNKPWFVLSSIGSHVLIYEDNAWFTRFEDKIHIKSIAEDFDGNMWVGSLNSGLYKFDGEEWTSYTTQNSDLARNFIDIVAVDNLGRIWVVYWFEDPDATKPHTGAFPSGVSIFDGKNWEHITTNNSELISNKVTAIAFDLDNRIWFGTDAGVQILNGNQWVLYTSKNSNLIADRISDIVFDRDGRAWIGSRDENGQLGLNIFDGVEWQHISLAGTLESNPDPEPEDDREPNLLVDQIGRVWVWVEDAGAIIFDGETQVGFPLERSDDNNLSTIASDQDGKIWVGTKYRNHSIVVLDSDYPLQTVWRNQPQRFFLQTWGIPIALILIGLFLIIYFEPNFKILSFHIVVILLVSILGGIIGGIVGASMVIDSLGPILLLGAVGTIIGGLLGYLIARVLARKIFNKQKD